MSVVLFQHCFYGNSVVLLQHSTTELLRSHSMAVAIWSIARVLFYCSTLPLSYCAPIAWLLQYGLLQECCSFAALFFGMSVGILILLIGCCSIVHLHACQSKLQHCFTSSVVLLQHCHIAWLLQHRLFFCTIVKLHVCCSIATLFYCKGVIL